MIDLQISAHHYEMNDKARNYVQEKIGKLDRLLPKHSAISGSIRLELDQSGREDNRCVCDATIQVPGTVFHAREATINMYAAIDIVEAKLKSQALKYKSKHVPQNRRRRVWLSKLFTREREAKGTSEGLE